MYIIVRQHYISILALARLELNPHAENGLFHPQYFFCSFLLTLTFAGQQEIHLVQSIFKGSTEKGGKRDI